MWFYTTGSGRNERGVAEPVAAAATATFPTHPDAIERPSATTRTAGCVETSVQRIVVSVSRHPGASSPGDASVGRAAEYIQFLL